MKKHLLSSLMGCLIFISASFAQVSFTADITNGCAPLTVNFTNTSTIGNYYQWTYYDSSPADYTTNATHTFNQPGNYQVQLSAFDTTGGGMVSLGFYYLPGGISVNGSSMGTTADTACPGESIGMSLWPQGNNYNWDFGDGNISTQSYVNHSYASPGTYTITVSVNTSCGLQTITRPVVIMNGATPDASFNFRNPVCPNESIQFHPRNWNAASYSWNFGDGSPVSTASQPFHVYSSAGNYPVTLTLTSSCATSSTQTDTINIMNGLQFGPGINIWQSANTVCPGDQINFDYGMDETAYQRWDFGNGDTAITKNVNYAYPVGSTGTYTVSLYLMNGCGYDTTLTSTVTISSGLPYSGNASMDIYPNAVCPGDIVYFYSSSAAYQLWNFGDSATSIQNNPEHTYSLVGTYTVTLTLTNGCGNDTTVTDTVNVGSGITPILDHSDSGNWGAPSNTGCPGDSLLFYASGGTSYLFDFGDGTSTTQTDSLVIPEGGGGGGSMTIDVVNHAYDTAGTYIVTLTYYNGCGNSATDTLHITIGSGNPVSGGMAPIGSSFTTCDTIDFLAYGGGTYSWDFGDGDSITSASPTVPHQFTAPGPYTITLTITNGCGNTASYIENITINSCMVSVNSAIKTDNVKVYPNPISTFAIIEIVESQINSVFELYDILGKCIMAKSLTKQQTSIDRGDLKSGIYFYRIINNKQNIGNGKLIIH